MKILWMTWKDRKNPLAGGAEVVNEELAKRLAKDGHEVILLVAGFDGAKADERRDGYRIVRVGSRWSVYWRAYRYYSQHLVGWADLVIDEVNTMPFFAKFYVKEPNIIFAHMLCREIWFYEMIFPLSLIGYVFEPVYLWLLRDRKVITVSESSKADLVRAGFKASKIHIISEGLEVEPLAKLPAKPAKPKTIISVGTIRSMKRTLHQIRAFEIAKESIPELQLIVVGKSIGRYGKRVERAMTMSKYADSIKYYGQVSRDKKLDLMRNAHLIIVTSIKEGWGLIVTEAASQGTPAVVYDVDGLRDSVRGGQTGTVVSENSPATLVQSIVRVLDDEKVYSRQRVAAWQWSKSINFDESYHGIMKAVDA